MNKEICALGIVAIVLTGCAAPSAESASPTATVTVTVTQPAVTVTATPPPASPKTTLMTLGESGTTGNGATVTVYEHKKNVEPQDANQEAIDVKVCVGPKPAGSDDYPVITSSPWVLYDGEDRRYTSASTTWSHEVAQPAYPTEQRVAWGDYVRGWVIIQGQAATTMTKVRYTAGSSILEWKLTG